MTTQIKNNLTQIRSVKTWHVFSEYKTNKSCKHTFKIGYGINELFSSLVGRAMNMWSFVSFELIGVQASDQGGIVSI